MFKKTILSLGALGMLTFAVGVQAATVTLFVPNGSVAANEQFTVALEIDATDLDEGFKDSISGEVLVEFDGGSLAVNGFEPVAPTIEISELSDANSIAIGFFEAVNIGTIGNFTFTALADIADLNTLSFGLSDTDDFFGTFAFENPSNDPFVPDFEVARVNVIPVPAAGWLMLSALGLLGFGARRTRA